MYRSTFSLPCSFRHGHSHLQKARHLLASVPYLQSKYSTSSSEQDYLHRSILPTDHFQKSLPRLPVPKLEKTCERYLASQRQILTDEEYVKTQSIVENFKTSDGEALQKELIAQDKQNKHTSYVTGRWFDMYLESRLPIVLNYNPFMVFSDDTRPEYQNQLLRATNMVVSSLKFMKTLRANILEPDVYHLNPSKTDNERYRKILRAFPQSVSWYGSYLGFKAFPLDMSQYGRLFNSTRIPRHKKDEFRTDETAKHLLVMRNGNYYIFDVIDTDGNIVKPEMIMAHLKYILQDRSPAPEYPVSYLTTEDRDKWATLRDQLMNAGNELTLQLIDTAAFALVLDDDAPQDPNAITRQFLHGDGVNRWFDKSFMLMLTPDGRACVNFEHAWGDGVAVLRYFNEVFKDSTEKSCVYPNSSMADVDSAKIVQKLEFKLDPFLKEGISAAKEKFNKSVGSLDVNHLEYEKYTKKYVKKQKISPDSVMQLAIQMAFYRQYGKTVATYESCSTAAFKHGRTETVRPATAATKKTVELFLNPENRGKVSAAELRDAMSECSNVHGQLTKEAAMGQGFDRHLFALRKLAEKSGKVPEIFQDPSYTKINHIILSTSTISSPAVVIGGFAPVVPDGYGIGYSIEDNKIGFNISSYPPSTNVTEFVDCIRLSLDDLYEVFEGRKLQ